MAFPVRVLEHIVPNRTPIWVRTLGLNVERLLELDTEQVRNLWNPQTCALDDLPYLAWGLSVDLWNPNWSETKKRSVVANALLLHRLKGTEEGLRRHLDVADCNLIRAIAPPARAYYTPALTDEGRLNFLEGLPQIRIYPFRTLRTRPKKRAFYDRNPTQKSNFYSKGRIKTFQQATDGPALYGRQATFYDHGTEVPAQYETFVDSTGAVAERVRIRSTGNKRTFYRGSFFGKGFYQKTSGDQSVISVRLSSDAVRQYSSLTGSKVTNVNPVRVYQKRTAPKGRRFFGKSNGFYCRTFAPNLIFDRVSILDTARLGERQKVRSFWGHSRYGIKPFHAELLVEVPMNRPKPVRGRFITGFWKKANMEKLQFSLDAIKTSKSFRDTILVDTQVNRRVRLDDVPKLGTFKLGEIRRLA